MAAPKKSTTGTRAKSAGRARGAAKSAAPSIAKFTKEQELHAYREMLLIRRFEEKAGQLYG
ncbi:MAG: pyruvate dehydrogenase (acetyl-transferring) E1 component subunit alpha, partial [Hyphomicrobiales bacterium]